ncbi:uncharacterized protein THITE_2154552 [Thermothielavioides terrestris NRRL 8126]|uniref:Uncharacterized protein n=1 Tax=Thermothielavioides terrestris (strain ATCC 38088 / NRRL 8126) TaxID=578455 RepID=G2R105_THETT|nr:uncharacterized protein THITE_2154552 [Thermothielavioides terrestris NRRL 8126]AEO66502.1 hypothetical protein THITE_2154552 [Thermothielavioides terrestris NRRL 8126]
MAAPRESWSLTEHLLATQEALYKSATQHPFLLAGAEGRLPKDKLSRWLANDRLYIHSYIRAAGQLLASIDLPQQIAQSQEAFETQLADWLIEALVAIRKEERFFIDVAKRYGLGIELVIPLPPASQTAAAAQDSTGSNAPSTGTDQGGKLPGLTLFESIFASITTTTPFPPSESAKPITTAAVGTSPPALLPWLEGALTFWGTERCYLDAWSWARDKAQQRSGGGESDRPSGDEAQDADGGALRREFIPNWSSPEFAAFVDRLGTLIDAAVVAVLEGKEGEERERVKAEILGRVEGKWKSLLEAERLQPGEAASSKLIVVLSRIETTLEALDSRLQALENSWPTLTNGANGVETSSDTNSARIKWTTHTGFVTKHRVNPDGKKELQEIVVEKGELLALLARVSSPCLNRDRDWLLIDRERGQKSFSFPFTELRAYRDVLRFISGETGPVDDELRAVFSAQPFSVQLQRGITDLLDCLNELSDLNWARDAKFVRNSVLFDDLPTILSPGMLLLGTSEQDAQQVVEVSACEMVSVSPTSRSLVIDCWHFRWNGSSFSRTSCRFVLERFSGTMPVDRLPYRPLLSMDFGKSIAELKHLMERNRAHLEVLNNISKTENGDYPLCNWFPGAENDAEQRSGDSECVILDPEAFALNTAEGTTTQSSVRCYCTVCTNSWTTASILENPRYLLLAPTRVEGFHLRTKKWVTLPIRELCLSPESENADAMDTAYLGKARTSSLKNKLASYFAKRARVLRMSKRGQSASVVERGLGRGLVLHFQGPRGAGKMAVASSLAAHSRRPLLSLRPGDLGLELATFERNLSFYSGLSLRWGAVMLLVEADDLLKAREPADMARNALIAALADKLEQFRGVMIFLSSPLAELDHALVPYVQQIKFFLNPERVRNVFCLYLDQLDKDFAESRDELADWVEEAVAKLQLSGTEVREIYHGAVEQAKTERRKLALKDLISAYTTKTGRPSEWDFVTDTTLYGSDQNGQRATTPQVAEQLFRLFGPAAWLPDDGRLTLNFTEAFLSTCAAPARALETITQLGNLTQQLHRTGGIQIVDWGWPQGLWAPTKGLVYRTQPQLTNETPRTPAEQWADAGFTLGIHLVDGQGSKPWRRLVLSRTQPWFHTVFFELTRSLDETQSRGAAEMRNTVRLYNWKMFTAPAMPFREYRSDPIRWTIVCLVPENFWSFGEAYDVCEAPKLSSQSACYVAMALGAVLTRWRDVLMAFDALAGSSGDVLRRQDQLQDILFDDDAFSTSKRYFWMLNFINEAIKLLDDSMQQCSHYRKWFVTPYQNGSRTRREYWDCKSQEVLSRAGKQVEEACEEFKLLRQEFQERLDRITVLRDGLGENVKLLTFVSIFFLPLGLCVAIWSINENYSRANLILVTAIVAAATYAVTFNLNNLVGGLRGVLAPRRRALLEQMERDPEWRTLGLRFKAFQRSETGTRRPSEWLIVLFWARQIVDWNIRSQASTALSLAL